METFENSPYLIHNPEGSKERRGFKPLDEQDYARAASIKTVSIINNTKYRALIFNPDGSIEELAPYAGMRDSHGYAPGLYVRHYRATSRAVKFHLPPIGYGGDEISSWLRNAGLEEVKTLRSATFHAGFHRPDIEKANNFLYAVDAGMVGQQFIIPGTCKIVVFDDSRVAIDTSRHMHSLSPKAREARYEMPPENEFTADCSASYGIEIIKVAGQAMDPYFCKMGTTITRIHPKSGDRNTVIISYMDATTKHSVGTPVRQRVFTIEKALEEKLIYTSETEALDPVGSQKLQKTRAEVEDFNDSRSQRKEEKEYDDKIFKAIYRKVAGLGEFLHKNLGKIATVITGIASLFGLGLTIARGRT